MITTEPFYNTYETRSIANIRDVNATMSIEKALDLCDDLEQELEHLRDSVPTDLIGHAQDRLQVSISEAITDVQKARSSMYYLDNGIKQYNVNSPLSEDGTPSKFRGNYYPNAVDWSKWVKYIPFSWVEERIAARKKAKAELNALELAINEF